MCPDQYSQRIALRQATEHDATIPVVGVENVQVTVELDGKALFSADPASSTALAHELSLRLARFSHRASLAVLCAHVPAGGTATVTWTIPGAAWLRYASCFGGASIVGARTARTDITPFTLPIPFDADDERVEFKLANGSDVEVVAELVLMIDSAYV